MRLPYGYNTLLLTNFKINFIDGANEFYELKPHSLPTS
jgi:hypothetical protein